MKCLRWWEWRSGYLGKDAQKTEAGDSNVAYDIKVEDSNNKAEQTV